MSKENDGIVLSEKWGVNPTIPICWYCEKEKNQLVMLGKEGEKVARLLGHEDGQMPRATQLPLDFEPCDACKKVGIGFIEITNEEVPEPTGHLWLLKFAAAKSLLNAQTFANAKQVGHVFILHQTAKENGFYGPDAAKEETNDAPSNP